MHGQASLMHSTRTSVPRTAVPHPISFLSQQLRAPDIMLSCERRCSDERKCAHPQVKCRSISQAHALHPAIGAVDLCVPAVLCIMRHLVVQMLPEPEPLRVDAYLYL